MIDSQRTFNSLRTLEHFVNNAFRLEHHADTLNGFHYNRELLKAAVANTYVETISKRADSLHLSIEKSSIDGIKSAFLSTTKAITKPFLLKERRVMLAFDYTAEDFYGDSGGRWLHGWTGEKGVKAKFSFLSVNLVDSDLRIPLLSIPSPLLSSKSEEISSLLADISSFMPLSNIDLALFDRGFYSKEVMHMLNSTDIPYLIFVPKNSGIREELSSMGKGEKKITLHSFEYTTVDGKKVRDSTHLAFLKRIFDHKTESYFDWVFATNVEDIDLDKIIRTYKMRWRIETSFRVQDEAKIKSKSTNIKVRYFLFAYEQLIESIWYLFYKERDSIPFKSFLIGLSDLCSPAVKREEEKRASDR